MTARTGMANLISRWRRMVNDGGTAVWTDDQAQTVLDSHRVDFWQQELTPAIVVEGSATVYKAYSGPFSDLEEVGSGSTAWRLYDSTGTTIGTANYAADYVRGVVLFTADQHGSARYLDGRSYDLAAAAAEGWRERMALTADDYTFSADGATYNRSDWFAHCSRMADYYDRMTRPTSTIMVRSDLV